MINIGADAVQAITLGLLLVCLAGLIRLAHTNWRYDWGLLLPALIVVSHGIVFYICVLFFPWEQFSFTHWSRWLRLHEVGTAAIIIVALVVRWFYWHRKIK